MTPQFNQTQVLFAGISKHLWTMDALLNDAWFAKALCYEINNTK